MMLQQPQAEDFVIATGEQHSVREFVDCAAHELGMALEWVGSGIDEHAILTHAPADSAAKVGQRIVAIDPRYHRPAEVDTLLGNPAKAREKLGWTARTGFDELVREMMAADLSHARRDALIERSGFRITQHHE